MWHSDPVKPGVQQHVLLTQRPLLRHWLSGHSTSCRAPGSRWSHRGPIHPKRHTRCPLSGWHVYCPPSQLSWARQRTRHRGPYRSSGHTGDTKPASVSHRSPLNPSGQAHRTPEASWRQVPPFRQTPSPSPAVQRDAVSASHRSPVKPGRQQQVSRKHSPPFRH